MRATAALTRAAKGDAVLTSSRFAPINNAPALAKWVWSSMKPGVMKRPPASTTRVRGVRCASTCALLPTAIKRSPRTASAWARGCAGLPVQMLALRTIRSASAAGACALARDALTANASAKIEIRITVRVFMTVSTPLLHAGQRLIQHLDQRFTIVGELVTLVELHQF